MNKRRYRLSDRVFIDLGRVLANLPKTCPRHQPHIARSIVADAHLAVRERRESAALMRVNHTGEMAAQGLYIGQGMLARRSDTRDLLARAASEETEHLSLCEARLRSLNGRTSYLAPAFYLGSVALGVTAGALGDRFSLGFVTETERQVEAHLDDHLRRLPAADLSSRALLRRIRTDEQRHGATATAGGGIGLPTPLRTAMRAMARVMTATTYWV